MGGSPREEEAASQDKVTFPGEEGEGNRVVVTVVKRLLQDVEQGWQQSWANQDTHLAEAEEQETPENWQNPHSCKSYPVYPAPELLSHVCWQLVVEAPKEEECQLLLKENPQLLSN